jgi:NADH-quinone oxidoreductase subunit F
MCHICSGTGCQAYGCQAITRAFHEELESRGLADQVDVLTTGCHGFCERGPVVVIKPEGIFYERMQLKDVPEVVEETLVHGRVIERLLYAHPQTGEKIVHEHDVPFYKLQQREILWMNGLIDPTSIEDYIAVGGYRASGQGPL